VRCSPLQCSNVPESPPQSESPCSSQLFKAQSIIIHSCRQTSQIVPGRTQHSSGNGESSGCESTHPELL
jgi:hypothetical protein